LGRFTDKLEAKLEYEKVAKNYFGEFYSGTIVK